MGLLRRRLRVMLMLVLCAAWTATPLIAEICAGAAPHCHEQMPCCPHSGGSGGNHCSPSLCPAEASQRVVLASAVRLPALVRGAVVPHREAEPVGYGPMQELTGGLHFSPAVFRLKDDLRI